VASVEFYFKGEKFSPSTVVDLDAFFQSQQGVEFFYLALAKSADIGLHSYELDVMMSETITFSQPTGIAVDFVEQGKVDWQGLNIKWQEHVCLKSVEGIAETLLNVEKAIDKPTLLAALMQAYSLGKKEGQKKSNLNEVFYG